MTTFTDLNISHAIIKNISQMGFQDPTKIQLDAIPHAMKGKDVFGQAKTGTGKTAAFALPIIEDLLNHSDQNDHRFRALILVPTRELADQVSKQIRLMSLNSDLTTLTIVGGDQDLEKQENQLRKGGNILVSTPGRLVDHLHRGYLDLSAIRTVVLDEADELLTKGFIEQVNEIIDFVPSKRQTHLFSATLPKGVEKLSKEFQTKPVLIYSDERSTPDPIEEIVYPVSEHQKLDLLIELIEHKEIRSMIVFARTRKKIDWLFNELWRRGYSADVLHSDKSLAERRSTMAKFNDEKFKILLATDIAARGLDIEHVSHVTNFDLPDDPQDYIHRVGRTGRIGRPGIAWSLMDPSELILLAKIERIIGKRIKEMKLENFPYENAIANARKQGRRPAYGDIKARSNRPTKENPFTKSGKAKKKYRITDDSPNTKKKKVKIKKKLPHTK